MEQSEIWKAGVAVIPNLLCVSRKNLATPIKLYILYLRLRRFARGSPDPHRVIVSPFLRAIFSPGDACAFVVGCRFVMIRGILDTFAAAKTNDVESDVTMVRQREGETKGQAGRIDGVVWRDRLKKTHRRRIERARAT